MAHAAIFDIFQTNRFLLQFFNFVYRKQHSTINNQHLPSLNAFRFRPNITCSLSYFLTGLCPMKTFETTRHCQFGELINVLCFMSMHRSKPIDEIESVKLFWLTWPIYQSNLYISIEFIGKRTKPFHNIDKSHSNGWFEVLKYSRTVRLNKKALQCKRTHCKNV